MNTLFSLCFFLISVFSTVSAYSESPWGKDAELTVVAPAAAQPATFVAGADTLILFHQQIISPADGPRSHYIPSSSSYALQAIRKHGFIEGFLMGCDRLLRENSEPWIYRHITTRDGDILKLDPIP